MTKDEVAELQQRIYLEGRKRYEAAHGKTIAEMDAELAREVQLAASSSTSAASLANSRAARVSKIKAVYEAYRAGRPEVKEPTPEPTKPERPVGPQERAALAFTEALRKLKDGQAGQAMSAPTTHKLEPFISYGR